MPGKGMDEFSKMGERMIDEAIASGELQPPTAGTRVDLDAYFSLPEEMRAGMAMLRGNGFAPPEIELLKQAETLEKELEGCEEPELQAKLKREIEELRVRFRMAVERLRQR